MKVRMTLIASAVALAFAMNAGTAQAEEEKKPERDSYKGLTLKLGDRQFIRFITWHQVWGRFTQLNPDSTVGGVPKDGMFDILLRRSRFLALAELNEFQILTHFGLNNQGFTSRRPGGSSTFFMHDAWVQYALAKNYVQFGAGLHYWHGVSRMTNASTLNFMTLDAPIVNWPTIERTDQFARFLGFWLKGQVGGFDYRVSVNKPFRSDRPIGPRADYRAQNNTLSLAGYFEYQFLDRESDKLPYKVGTYIGNKTVFNLGAGFYYHPESMQTVSDDPDNPDLHDQVLIGVDAYVDLPFGERESGGALSAYLAFYNYDFGPNHLRIFGIGNVSDGPTQGNAYPIIGTGQHVYFQLGYLLPPNVFGGFEFMPYVATQTSIMEALDDPMIMTEGGLNWFLQGHHAKITFAFRNRPVFLQVDPMDPTSNYAEDSRASEFIIQTHIFL